MDKNSVSITITPGTIVSVIAIGFLVWLLYYLRDLVLIVLTAVVLSSAIEPGVQWFIKKKFGRTGAVLSVFGLVLIALFGLAYFLFPPLYEEARGVIVDLPQFMQGFNADSLLSNSFAQSVFSGATLSGLLLQLQGLLLPTGEGALMVLSSVFGGVFSFLLIIVLSVYFALQETGVDDFLRLVVPVKHQEYAVDLWKRSHYKIGLWMQGQLILSAIIGILGFLWLAIFQVPYAFLIAVFAAVVEIIPVFGSFISGAVAVIVAAVAGGPGLALVIAGGFLVINLLQSNLIYPLVVKQVVGVPPLMVILSMIAGGQIAGFLGVVLAVPVAAAIREFVSDIQKNRARELRALAK
jgi:predicted PurR-regulated permease PerM